MQKALHAHYLEQAVDLEAGDLDAVCSVARRRKIAVALGTIERPRDRGGHSAYCSLVYVAPNGEIASAHRKLMPTYEERLSWATGDGHGLVTHRLGRFTVGALNCWENWMPLVRTALYAQGEDLHVASWPGNDYNTRDVTRFAAREGRSYVVAASALMRRRDIPGSVPHAAMLRRALGRRPIEFRPHFQGEARGVVAGNEPVRERTENLGNAADVGGDDGQPAREALEK